MSLSLDDRQEVPPISLDDSSDKTIPMAPDVAAVRATKAKFGLPELNLAYDDYYNMISQGAEKPLRNQVASELDLQKYMQKQQLISEFAKNSEGPLTEEGLARITNAVNTKPADPTSILEESYARRYMSTVLETAASKPGTWMDDALREVPKHVNDAVEKGMSLLMKRQLLLKEREDAQEMLNQQGWPGFIGDSVRNIVPFAYQARLSDNIPGADPGLLGEHLENQRQVLIGLPDAQFKAALVNVKETLKDNPQAWLAFVDAMVGQTSTERTANNVLPILDAMILPAIGRLGVAALGKVGLINQSRQLVREMVQVAKTADFPVGHTPWTVPEVSAFTTRPTAKVTAKVTDDVSRAFVDDLTQTEHQVPPKFNTDTPEYKAFVDDGTKEVFQKPNVIEDPEAAALDGVGDLEKTAVKRITSRVIKGFQGDPNIVTREAMEALPQFMKRNATELRANPGAMGQEIMNRVATKTGIFTDEIMNAVATVSKATRLPGITAAETVSTALKDSVIDNWPGVNNRVLDISDVYHVPATNNYFVDSAIGRNTATLFASFTEAKNAARALRIEDPKIEPKGYGYYIRLRTPLREQDSVIQNYLREQVKTSEGATPTSWHSIVTNWLRNPDDALSTAQRENRKVVAYVPSVYIELAKKNLSDLARDAGARFRGQNFSEVMKNRGKWQDWDRTIRNVNNEINPDAGEKGYFFKNGRELSDFYQKTFGRVPDEVEAQAYFAFRDNVEMFKLLRNLHAYSMATRSGAEEFSTSILDSTGKRIQSPKFAGILEKEMPGGEWTFAVLGDGVGNEAVYSGGRIPQNVLKALKEDVLSGKKVAIQIYDPETRPLSNFRPMFKDKTIRYIIANTAERSDLPLNLVRRDEGGLIEYDHKYAIKQAKIRQEMVGNYQNNHYEGDLNITGVADRAMGLEIEKGMNTVRELIRKGDEVAAKNASDALGLPFPWDEHLGWYKPSRDLQGNEVSPKINVNEPVRLVSADETIGNLDQDLATRYTNNETGIRFIDSTRQGSLARQNQIELLGDVDKYESFKMVKDKGSRYNPLYSYEAADVVDPISTMNRAMSKMVNSTVIDDYKIFSMNSWLAENYNILKADADMIKYSPWSVFMSATSPEHFKPDASAQAVSNALQSRWKIKQLTGTPSVVDSYLQTIAQDLADGIYSRQGPGFTSETPFLSRKGLGEKTLLAPSWMLSHITDPVKYARAIALHTFFSFNPAQLVVQSMTWNNIFAISPRYAGVGLHGAVLHQYGRINPGMLDTIDGWASGISKNRISQKVDDMFGAVQWKPGEWKEAHQEMLKTGFDNIGAEHSFTDWGTPTKLVKSAGADFLDAGLVFWKGADRNVRYGAWYTAFKEFRDANPTGRITQEQRNQILDRADMYAGNMSRASKSTLETGVFSAAAQFVSYPLRMLDLLLTKRLDMAAKARLLGTWGVLFGVPTGIAGAAIYPFGDMIRQYAEKNGYVVGEKWLSSLTMEGGISSLIAMISGGGDIKKGNWYNVGPRLGNPGVDTIQKLIAGDTSMLSMALGASGSKFQSTWESTDGFRYSMMKLFQGDQKAFPYSASDMFDIAKELSVVNAAWRARVAINTGLWLSKNEGIVAKDISPANALFMTMTGLQPQAQTEGRTIVGILKEDKALRTEGEKKAMQEFMRGINALNDKNPQEYRKAMVRAKFFMDAAGIPLKEQIKVIGDARKQNQDLISRLFYESTFGKDVPTFRRQQALESYRTRQQMIQGK